MEQIPLGLIILITFLLFLSCILTKKSQPQPFFGDIVNLTLENKHYRKVLHTNKRMQLVLMSLKPGEEIGTEIHPGVSQFFRIEQGEGLAIVDQKQFSIKDDDVLVIPPGAKHNIINTHPRQNLKLYSLYSPPEHPPHAVQTNKSSQKRSL